MNTHTFKMELTSRHYIISIWITIIICLMVIPQLDCHRRNCKFPDPWQGSWYQSGLGHIQIGPDTMSKKGTCIQHYSDFFIIENIEKGCIICLLMLERHESIVQYKESYCVATPNMQTVCSLIQVEGVMYTLVKDSSPPIRCPFHGNYDIDYRDHTHSYCQASAQSELLTCTDTDILRFKFKHCSQSAVMHNTDVQFECVATWKEGSEELLYGRFSGSAIANKRDSYRCFKYEKKGYDVQLSMSADATCRGLITAEMGPIMMKLDKKRTVPEPDCTYPRWLSSKKWVDLTGYHLLSVHKQKLTLKVTHSHRAISQLSCYQTKKDGPVDHFISGYFRRDKCHKDYNCMHFIEIHRSVFLFYVGVIYPSVISAEQCMQNIPEKSSQYIFIDSELDTVQDSCPFTGKYTLPTEMDNCLIVINVGCNEPNMIKVESLCDNHTDSVFMFECKRYWTESDTISVLLNDYEDNIVCLNIKEKQNTLRIKRCTISSEFYPKIRLEENLYVTKKGSCPTEEPVILLPDNSINHNNSSHNKHRHKPKQTDKPPDITKEYSEKLHYLTTLKPLSEELIKIHSTKSMQSSDLLVKEEVESHYKSSAEKTDTVFVEADNMYMASSTSALKSTMASSKNCIPLSCIILTIYWICNR